MPEFCTCGAQLPPDALFCHKCGKPQRSFEVPEVHTPEHAEFAPPAPQVKPQPLPLNFHNPVAVRIAFMVAVAATLLSWLPWVNLLACLMAGFFSVYFYSRRTGYSLNVKSGALMGWITGVLMFALSTVVLTATIVPVAASGGLGALFRSQLKNTSDPNVQEALRMLESGPGLAVLMVVTLIMLFALITFLSMAGGMLGAKLVRHGN